MSQKGDTEPAPFNYQPPSGGDVMLKSSDGSIFTAHSAFLALASPVFGGMFSSDATRKDVVELAEVAESVSLMLRFIYPPAFLSDLSLPLLKKSLIMAQKYNIEGISATIDYIISRSFDGNCPLGLDPVETFALAASHQLKAGQKAAARSVKLLEDVEDFENLAHALPQYSGIIGLLGAQSMRTKVLVKVLANLQRLDAIPSREGGYHVDQYDVMICRECRDKLSYTLEPYMGYRPDWVYRWATTALNELVNKSLSECEHLFHISILHELGEDRGCRDCIRAALEVKDGECFKSWAEDMRSELQDALRGVDCLYGL